MRSIKQTPGPNAFGQSWGRGACGYPIGIIAVNTDFPLLPGNVANATTFSFPVYIKVLKDISGSEIMKYNADYINVIADAGLELVELGVRAVVGACGSFANYQKDVAAILPVPTYLSVMLQAPLILQGLQPKQTLGVIAARASALTDHVYEQCGISSPERLKVVSAMDLNECNSLYNSDPGFDNNKLEQDLVNMAKNIVREHPDTGAILIQCSDLPPYACAIRQALQLPVFDQTTLINWVYNAVVRARFDGYL